MTLEDAVCLADETPRDVHNIADFLTRYQERRRLRPARVSL